MVNAILLHVVSNISGFDFDVSIVPEFRMESTRFEYAATSYGGVVDFLIVKGPPDSISNYGLPLSFRFSALLIPPSSVQNFYLGDLSSRLRTQIWSNISRQTFTKPREMGLGMQYHRLLWQVHHIADNTSKYLRYLRDEIVDDLRSLSTFRGCVTNGEIWVFFIFNAAHSGEGGTVSISDEFRLGEDLSGLPLVLGLLSDWVSFNHYSSFEYPNLISSIQIMNSKEREQQFFKYFSA